MFLVAKLEGLEYHIEHASLTVQRTKRVELPSGEFIFPMRLLKDPASHPPVADAKARSDPVPLERGQAQIEEPAASEQSEAKTKPVMSGKSGRLTQAECPRGRLCLMATCGMGSKRTERPLPEQLRADAKKAVLETTVSTEVRSEHPDAASSAKPTTAAPEGEPTMPVIRPAPATSVLPERDKPTKEQRRPQLNQED